MRIIVQVCMCVFPVLYLLSPCQQFMQDAAEVMSLLLKLQTEQGGDMEPDDPQVGHTLTYVCSN